MTKYTSIIITIIVVIALGILVYMQWGGAPVQQVPAPVATTTTAAVPLPTPVILGVTMGTALTPEGTAVTATTEFKKTDNIYAVLALKDSLARTPIS